MRQDVAGRRSAFRWLTRGAFAALVAGNIGGCANLWDDMTARNFHVKSLFTQDDPLTVLSTSTDGDERARALRALKEPRANGGTSQTQDQVMEIVARAATSEPQPHVRIAAIETLGRFQDARTVQALTSAYESANQLTGDAANTVRCLALNSLGQTKQPGGVQLLIQVATNPIPPDASEKDRQQIRDCRLAAVRALRNFEGSTEVREAMTRLLQNETDVALRDRAKETYAAVSGSQPAAPSQVSPEAPKPAGNPVQVTGGVAQTQWRR